MSVSHRAITRAIGTPRVLVASLPNVTEVIWRKAAITTADDNISGSRATSGENSANKLVHSLLS